MITLSLEHLKKMRERYLWNGVSEVTTVLDELIARRELEGEQVPVAIWEIVNPGEGTYFSVHDPKPGNVVRSTYGKLPFPSPQNPVVLPEGFHPDGDTDCGLVIDYADAVAAIEAAGGKVAE